LKIKQKAERKAKDEAIDAAFIQYLTELQKKDIKKQREDDKARYAKSKFTFTLYSNINVILNYRIIHDTFMIVSNIHTY